MIPERPHVRDRPLGPGRGVEEATVRQISSLTPAVVAASRRPAASAALAAAPAAARLPRSPSLRCEYKVDPLGIDVAQPRLSWQLRSDGARRRAVGLPGAGRRATAKTALGHRARSPRTAPSTSPTAAPRSSPRGRYTWRVRVWDGGGKPSAWSAPASLGDGAAAAGGLEGPLDRGGPDEDAKTSQPAPMLRGDLRGEGEGALGARLRHEPRPLRAGAQRPARGRPALHPRLDELQQAPAVPDLRRHRASCAPGENAIGATLGDGWYRGYLAWEDRRNVYGDRLGAAVPAAASSTRTAGSRRWAPTGPGSRRPGRSACRTSTTARPTTRGSSGPAGARPGYADDDWAPVRVVEPRDARARRPGGPAGAPDRGDPAGEGPEDARRRDGRRHGPEHGRLGAPEGAGARRARRSRCATPRCSTRHGNFYTGQPAGGEAAGDATPSRAAARRCTSRTSPSRASATSRSRAGPASRRSTASPASSSTPTCRPPAQFDDARTRCSTSCSTTSVWGQKGNFLDVPTDCPQRDERLGWTGDAQVFARTAAFNMDVAGFFTKWLRRRGRRPARRRAASRSSCPTCSARRDQLAGGSAAWADAAVIIPWTHVPVLRRHAPARAPVPEHDGAGSSTCGSRPATSDLWNDRLPLRRLARLRDDAHPTTRAPRPART